MFREYKDEPNSNNIANYFISLIESLMCFNYSAINLCLQKLNLLPESIIILLGPIIMPFILFFIFFFDNIYLIYLWFSNFGWLFKINENIILNTEINETNKSDKPKWKYTTLEEPIAYAWALFLLLIFFILFWFVLFLALPVLPFITLTICVVSCLFYKGVINNEPVYLFDIIVDVFKYNKVTIMIIISLFSVFFAFTNLNSITGWLSIVFILLIYFDLININLFKNILPMDLSYPVVSSNVAPKTPIVGAIELLSKGGNHLLTAEKKALTNTSITNEEQTGGKNNHIIIKKLKKIISQ